jgi:streptogramin lyase
MSRARGGEVVAPGDALWRSAFVLGTVTRWDAATGRQQLSVAVPTALYMTDTGPLWVSEHHGGVIVRLDERTGRVVQTVRVGRAGLPGAGSILSVGPDLWVAHVTDQNLVEVDPSKGSVVARVPLGVDACERSGLAAGVIWACLIDDSDNESVRRLDPATGALGPAVSFPAATGPAAEIAGAPWVPVLDELVRMDPATGRAVSAVSVDVPGLNIQFALEAFGSVWLLSDDGRVVRLDSSAPS